MSAPPYPAVPMYHNKRKRDNEASMQRCVAQKLQLCADVNDAFLSTQRARNRQLQHYQVQKSRADELSRLHLAIEQMTHFQTFLGAEMDGKYVKRSQVLNLKKQMNKLQTEVSSTMPVRLRIQKIVRQLPRLIKKATSIVLERRQKLIKDQKELPAKHQWVPMVLWTIYHQLEDAVRTDSELKSLKTAMRDVMKTLKEMNPFFYLQVIYQPPPEHLEGQWRFTASKELTAILSSMAPYFHELKRRSVALLKTNDSFVRIHNGWNQLRVTLTFVRRAARHFHFLILHLYALAMEHAPSNMHSGIITEKAARGFLSDDAKLRSRLRLCRANANSEDYLLMESYEWTPELLVYLDVWRRNRDKRRINFGFGCRESLLDFLPQFLGKKHSRQILCKDVLAEIGYHLHYVQRVWRKSKLSTSRFESMSIEYIGVVEKKIKGGLGTVVDLVYKMMLARWMDRRKRPAEWWASLQLSERNHFDREHELLVDFSDTISGDYSEDSKKKVSQHSLSDIVDLNENLQGATDGKSVDHKETQRSRVQLPAVGGFRRPSTVTLFNRALTSKEEATEFFSTI